MKVEIEEDSQSLPCAARKAGLPLLERGDCRDTGWGCQQLSVDTQSLRDRDVPVRYGGLVYVGEVQVGRINMDATSREMGFKAGIWMGTLRWGCNCHLAGSSLVL